jgi:hypothetical protein
MRAAPLLAGHPRGAGSPPRSVATAIHLREISLELITMDETARQNALRALQRSMDRRDNGGSTGHEAR